MNNEEKLDEAEILSTSFQSVNTTDQPYTSKNSKLKVNYSWFLSSKKIILEFKTNKQTRYSCLCKEEIFNNLLLYRKSITNIQRSVDNWLNVDMYKNFLVQIS